MSDYIEQMARVHFECNYSNPWEMIDRRERNILLHSMQTAFQSLWIDIAEHGLPDQEKPVWFCEEDGTIHRGTYEGDAAWWDEDTLGIISSNVTHYIPVFTPPPPKRNETHPTD